MRTSVERKHDNVKYKTVRIARISLVVENVSNKWPPAFP